MKYLKINPALEGH